MEIPWIIQIFNVLILIKLFIMNHALSCPAQGSISTGVTKIDCISFWNVVTTTGW